MIRIYPLILIFLSGLLLAEKDIEEYVLGYQNASVLSSLNPSPYRNLCHADSENFITYSTSCELGHSNVRLAVFGDSHGVELSFALSQALEKYQIGVRQHTFSGCPPSLNTNRLFSSCNDWTLEILKNLNADKSIEWVILTYRIQFWIENDLEGISTTSNSPLVSSSLQDLMSISRSLLKNGKKVLIIDEVPLLPRHIKEVLFDHELTLEGDLYLAKFEEKTPRVRFQTILDPKIVYLDPFLTFCRMDKCLAVKKHKSLYFDDNHISVFGARILSVEILGNLSQALIYPNPNLSS